MNADPEEPAAPTIQPAAPAPPAISATPVPDIAASLQRPDWLEFVYPCPWPLFMHVTLTTWGYPQVLAGLAIRFPASLPEVGHDDTEDVMGSMQNAERNRHPVSMVLDVRPSASELRELNIPATWRRRENHTGSHPEFVLALCKVKPHVQRILVKFRKQFRTLVRALPSPLHQPQLPMIHIALVDHAGGNVWADAWRVMLRHALSRRSYITYQLKSSLAHCTCMKCVWSPLDLVNSRKVCEALTEGYSHQRAA